jgi:DNA repair protein RecO (recombination protein O)
MSLETTPALLLKAYNWSESSRTIVFFTKRLGRLALVDKGGRQLKSRRGRPMPFALLEITYYDHEKESTCYLSDVELLEQWEFAADGNLGRLAYGSAALELLNLLLPEDEAHEDVFNYTCNFMGLVAASPRTCLPSLFIAYLLRLLSQLGYHPSLSYCVGCGRDIEEWRGTVERVAFSAERGGIVCPTCQSGGDYYITPHWETYRRAMGLQTASLAEAATVSIGFTESTQVLEMLVAFIGAHTGAKSDLKSLVFLEKLKSTTLTQ